ncbi:cupin domain-containing protein [Streptomyces alkaliphilus]|uniref:Cupin domain-containing protein n=1 Tax=Streptomyces alkaliphilus TaxID=1472722 RepID=A0A7W3TA94_9ACTN|nr:cupin domain-containing protein [Streptomyces alkaliphilus]MBB0243083.1 cupin domain-containing protein [Streptomyces alkaliphilus]
MSFEEQWRKKVVHVPPGEGPSRWAFGDKYTIKSGEHNTGGHFFMMEALVPPGGGPPPHIHHREEEAFYVLEGDVSLFDGMERLRLSSGSFVHVPRGSVHSFKNETEEDAKLLIMFLPGGKDNFFLGAGVSADDGAPPPPAEQYELDVERALRVAAEFGDEYIS